MVSLLLIFNPSSKTLGQAQNQYILGVDSSSLKDGFGRWIWEMDRFEGWLKMEQIREETGREVQFASLHVMSFQFAYSTN
jgi:hypothetical protein